MIQRRDGARLALEALGEFALGDLQRDDAVQARIAGLVNLAHPARADGREDLVGAEFVASVQHWMSPLALHQPWRECSRLEAAPNPRRSQLGRRASVCIAGDPPTVGNDITC